MMHARVVAIACLLFVVSVPHSADARYTPSKKDKRGQEPQRALSLDGLSVHNVGELHMHVTNWGEFGSRPDAAELYSWAPSAQWPGGSGIEYLYTAGIWVGAVREDGIPAVSTAAFDKEFRPTRDPIDVIYRTSAGSKGGNRSPDPEPDDDGDGLVDEDRLDGHDNDLDGSVDEDFAAISNQMFSCWYTDEEQDSRIIYPDHNPLHLMVQQESYQWSNDRFDDFVGVEFKITNIGDERLTDVFFGIFMDPDVGPRKRSAYWQDDRTGHVRVPVLCTDLGPVSVDFAYAYDGDGDGGRAPGKFGVEFLNHPTDPTGDTAPRQVGFSTVASFAGTLAFEEGGDPANDFERYEILSRQVIGEDRGSDLDYRMLVSTGPFKELEPESTIVFQLAFVVDTGDIANAASAQLVFKGAWFDLQEGTSGYAGRETPVVGPKENVFIDTCLTGIDEPVAYLPRGNILWINHDCADEDMFKLQCGYTEADSFKYKTGIDGRETQIPWLIGMAPPPPRIRIDDHSDGGVTVYWDNYSEISRDIITGQLDFEGYMIWRADNWRRPVGTSKSNGPPTELWNLLFQLDLENNFGDDTGMDAYRYEPLTHAFSSVQKADFIQYMAEYLRHNPDGDPPCPQGVTEEQCDTLKALTRWSMGLDEGRQYYRFTDRSVNLGQPYFYAIVAYDHTTDEEGNLVIGLMGEPSANFRYVEPQSTSQALETYDTDEVYVVPNPVTRETMEAWTLEPTANDPSGIKIEFRNLPRARGTIRIYTVSGDLVEEIPFDGTTGIGTVKWDLVSRNGQDITSGVYLYSIEFEGGVDRVIGKFVVIL